MADDTPRRIVIELEGSDTFEDGSEGKVRFRSDDISSKNKKRLGEYLSLETKEAGNTPAIGIGTEEISLRSASGKPAALNDTNNLYTGATPGAFRDEFIDIESQPAISNFDTLSDTELLDVKVKKGKTDTQEGDTGQELLIDLNTNKETSKLGIAISTRLESTNRFAPGEEYVDPNTGEEENNSKVGSMLLQRYPGVHTPRNWPEVAGDTREIKYRIKDLKNLGIQTLLEASGEYYVPDDPSDAASATLAKLASTVPGKARMGIRIPTSKFDAATIVGNVNGEYQQNTKFPSLKGNDIWSYGNPNNPLAPFDAVSSTSTSAAAILLTLTISEIIKILASVLGPPAIDIPSGTELLGSVVDLETAPKPDPLEFRKKRLGSYYGKDKNQEQAGSPLSSFVSSVASPSKFFLLVPTQNEYSKAVQRGVEVFFGSPPSAGGGGFLSAVGGVALATVGFGSTYSLAQENPGYFNVLLRMLIRATSDDIGNVMAAGAGFIGAVAGDSEISPETGGLDINKQIGLDGDPTNILNAVSSLRDSKLMRFMDIVAAIGDAALMIGDDGEKRFESTIDQGVIDSQEPDALGHEYPNPAALIKKNRLSVEAGAGYAGSMAWGTNTLRSMYLLPTEYGQAEKTFSGVDTTISTLTANKNFKLNEGRRFSKTDVQTIERELDSYYMPFYFHDLRTNEIISFHAFIENVSDSFDAEYAESDGYGRIGKVAAYKNTNRSINCSFRVVASSKKDFSEMWFKINKLVMLIYPQYTAGRLLKNKEGSSFYQPFSQLISNSPLIRFRLGDLLKSNYSEFDLARLFGIGSKNFAIDGETITAPLDKKEIEKVQGKIINIGKLYEKLIFESGDSFFVSNPSFAGSRKPQTSILKYKNGDKIPELPDIVKITVKKWTGVGSIYDVSVSLPGSKIKGDLIADFTGQSGYSIVWDWKYIVNKARSSTPGIINSEPELAETLDSNSAMQDFFSTEKNPIFKAFDSTAGQGLAGTIRKISFDWSDARWDTEGLNHRAPMWCKIDIDFAPVHDLNPGIDSTGAMIAPPYNIGSLMNLYKIKRDAATQEEELLTYAMNKFKAATLSKEGEPDDSLIANVQDFLPISF